MSLAVVTCAVANEIIANTESGDVTRSSLSFIEIIDFRSASADAIASTYKCKLTSGVGGYLGREKPYGPSLTKGA